jgi:hypothetical protein
MFVHVHTISAGRYVSQWCESREGCDGSGCEHANELPARTAQWFRIAIQLDTPTNLQQVSTTRITNPDGSGVDYPDIISFDPAHDAAGAIRSYEVFVDGRSLGSIGLPAGQFSIFRAWADTYTSQPCGPTAVQLRAYDSSLNESALSAPLSVLFPEYENCPPPHRDR